MMCPRGSVGVARLTEVEDLTACSPGQRVVFLTPPGERFHARVSPQNSGQGFNADDSAEGHEPHGQLGFDNH